MGTRGNLRRKTNKPRNISKIFAVPMRKQVHKKLKCKAPVNTKTQKGTERTLTKGYAIKKVSI